MALSWYTGENWIEKILKTLITNFNEEYEITLNKMKMNNLSFNAAYPELYKLVLNMKSIKPTSEKLECMKGIMSRLILVFFRPEYASRTLPENRRKLSEGSLKLKNRTEGTFDSNITSGLFASAKIGDSDYYGMPYLLADHLAAFKELLEDNDYKIALNLVLEEVYEMKIENMEINYDDSAGWVHLSIGGKLIKSSNKNDFFKGKGKYKGNQSINIEPKGKSKGIHEDLPLKGWRKLDDSVATSSGKGLHKSDDSVGPSSRKGWRKPDDSVGTSSGKGWNKLDEYVVKLPIPQTPPKGKGKSSSSQSITLPDDCNNPLLNSYYKNINDKENEINKLLNQIEHKHTLIEQSKNNIIELENQVEQLELKLKDLAQEVSDLSHERSEKIGKLSKSIDNKECLKDPHEDNHDDDDDDDNEGEEEEEKENDNIEEIVEEK